MDEKEMIKKFDSILNELSLLRDSLITQIRETSHLKVSIGELEKKTRGIDELIKKANKFDELSKLMV